MNYSRLSIAGSASILLRIFTFGHPAAMAVTSFSPVSSLQVMLVTSGNVRSISCAQEGGITSRILGKRLPSRTFLSGVVMEELAWTTWKVCTFGKRSRHRTSEGSKMLVECWVGTTVTNLGKCHRTSHSKLHSALDQLSESRSLRDSFASFQISFRNIGKPSLRVPALVQRSRCFQNEGKKAVR